MTAKEIQLEFIKTYLKPTLKNYGFKTGGQNWWKSMGTFFIVINLQNSQWNSQDDLSFCLNIGVALTDKLTDKEKKKAGYFDMVVHLREESYLTNERKEQNKIIRDALGYKITKNTNLTELIDEFKIDLEENIMKTLNGFQSLSDCHQFYKQSIMWGDTLKRQAATCGILLD